jgi:aspartate oxidase
VFGSRAARAALADTPDDAVVALPAWRFEPPEPPTREAVWRHAGPLRDRAGLEPLLADRYALARLIARSALDRRESRGAHRRSDFPLPDPALDGAHLFVDAAGEVRTERWT